MHVSRRLLFTVAAVIALGVAMPTRPAARVPVSVTILHFNDVYEIDAVEGGHSGGLSRVATVIDRLKRTSAPLITLGGDYLSPSAIGTARIDGQALAGKQMVDVLNAVGLQWATFGNHEFDVSEAAFHARLAEGKFGIVSSNVTDATGKPFERTVPSTVVPMRAGGRTVRVGLIGLTIDSTVKPWVHYTPPVDAARAQVAALKGKTDAIVALTHLSLASDAELASAVPEIDLILGGHEHENWLIRRGPHFTPIVKADANVRSLAIVTLTVGAAPRPTVTARLEVIDDKVAKSARVESLVRRWVTTAFNAFRADGFTPDRTITTITEPLDGRESTVRNRPGNMTDLILAAMRREAGSVDVALLNGGSVRIDDVLPAGPVSEYDVIRVLPFGGKIVKATFDGSLLISVLDAGVANQGSGGYLQRTGVAQLDNGSWTIQGRPVDPAGRYTVVLPDFLLTGGEARLGFLTRTNPMVHDIQDLRDVRLAVIDELRSR